MFTPEQAEQFNTLIYEFSEGEFKTKQGINIFYGKDSKERDFLFLEIIAQLLCIVFFQI